MTTREILKMGDPRLLRVAQPVREFDTPELHALIADMFDTMHAADGAGLAAPQIGVSRRLFVMDCSGGQDPEARVALVNPVVLSVEGDQTGDEGCLSFPGIFFQVKRNLRAVVRAQDLNGEEFEFDGLDLEARCMLHETDHCDGIVFIDRTTSLKRELVRRKIKRLQKQGRWV